MPGKSKELTPLELELMKVLWLERIGPLSVQEVRQRIVGRSVAYTTVQTMLNILVRKGWAKRTLVERSYRYRPAVSREKAAGSALKNLVQKMFGGSAEALVLNLIDTRQMTPETLQRLHELVQAEEERDDH
ncbi:MAG TPA: BlaI/MecI/CopY family transcriptional regulator [Thermoanaerobaculia bacterium]|nr:BlaI/MecI/CopY family transcriptional regulator [Thermoanaerobaculia bacterium]